MTGGTRERERSVEDRERLEALFGNVSEPTVEYVYEDGEPIVLAVNDAFEEVFGYDAEAIVGESLDEFIVPAGEEDEAADLNERVADGQALEAEVRRETADGPRTFMLRDAPIETADGVRGFAIYADITDRVERERELRRQNQRLEEFASVVSHDLRNPLTVARGYLDAAVEDPETYVPEIAASLERMEDIIDDVLTLAQQGEEVGDPTTVDLESVARRAWRNVETDGATLRVEGTRELDADPDRLLHVFENLFRNSVEHGSTDDRPPVDHSVEHGSTGNRPEAGDSVEHGSTGDRSPTDHSVEHGSTDDRPWADTSGKRDSTGDPLDATDREVGLTVRVGTDGGGFYVEDDGCGIPERHRDRVFESGFTTSETGTGFGLSIVQRICEAHGWEPALVEGTEGGARFEVRGIDGGP